MSASPLNSFSYVLSLMIYGLSGSMSAQVKYYYRLEKNNVSRDQTRLFIFPMFPYVFWLLAPHEYYFFISRYSKAFHHLTGTSGVHFFLEKNLDSRWHGSCRRALSLLKIFFFYTENVGRFATCDGTVSVTENLSVKKMSGDLHERKEEKVRKGGLVIFFFSVTSSFLQSCFHQVLLWFILSCV